MNRQIADWIDWLLLASLIAAFAVLAYYDSFLSTDVTYLEPGKGREILTDYRDLQVYISDIDSWALMVARYTFVCGILLGFLRHWLRRKRGE